MGGLGDAVRVAEAKVILLGESGARGSNLQLPSDARKPVT